MMQAQLRHGGLLHRVVVGAVQARFLRLRLYYEREGVLDATSRHCACRQYARPLSIHSGTADCRRGYYRSSALRYGEERLHSASVSADRVRPRLRNEVTGPTATTSLMHSLICGSFLARLERPTQRVSSHCQVIPSITNSDGLGTAVTSVASPE